MNFNSKWTAALMALALMLTAASGGALAASVDTTTTDPATGTSDITAGYNQTYNQTTESELQVKVTSQNPKVTIYQGSNASGTELATYTESEMTLVASNSTSGEYWYSVNVSDDASDYDGIEVAPTNTTDLTANIVDNSTLDPANQTEANVTWQFQNGETEAFVRADASETKTAKQSAGLFGVSVLSFSAPSFNLSMSSLSSGFGLLGADSSTSDSTEPFTGAAQINETIHPTSNTTTATIDFETSKTMDAASTVLNNSDGFSTIAYAQYGDKWVPVVTEKSAAPDWLDTSSATYIDLNEGGAVMHNVNGTSATELTLTLNEQADDKVIDGIYSSTDLAWYKIAQKKAFNIDTNGAPSWEAAT